jgi:hypothetical protein
MKIFDTISFDFSEYEKELKEFEILLSKDELGEKKDISPFLRIDQL